MRTNRTTLLKKKPLLLMHKLTCDFLRNLFTKQAALLVTFATFTASLGCQMPGGTNPAISDYMAPSNNPVVSQDTAPVIAQVSDRTNQQEAIKGNETAVVKRFTDLPAPGSNQHYRSGQPVSGQSMAAATAIPEPENSTDLPAMLATNNPTASSSITPPSQTTQLSSSPASTGIQQTGWMTSGAVGESASSGATGIRLTQATAPVVDEITGQLNPPGIVEDPINTVPLDVELTDTTTGRFMFGVGVNSDAGLTGQVMINERNFNYRDIPLSLRDLTNGRDFRDGGQGLRIEAMPGNLLQRYMFMFTDPYFIPDPTMSGHDISLNISGFYYDRRFYDWSEQRLGGRAAFGYRITDDLSLSLALRAEEVTIHSPRVQGVPQLEEVLGDNELFSGELILSHDTRDVPFLPTEGHFVQLSFSQTFGAFSYPRAEADLRRHFLLKERADGSGRQTLSVIMQTGFSGSDTPIYERFFAGGFSTIRGFDFRGASPVNGGVVVGGDFRFITSVEYMFPLTADDMLKGVAFCDFGTVEESVSMPAESFRVSPGFGLRIAVPMLGPAPLALDFAVPVNYASTDQIQNFSFFLGLGRS